MATSRLSTGRTFSLTVQFVCVLMFFSAGISAALETSGPRSTLSTSHHGYQNLEVNSEHRRYSRRGWATRSRHIHTEPAFRESYSQARKSILKNVDYGDDRVLVVSTDGAAAYSSIQDAINQVPENNTRRTTIYITSGVYE
jgi:hypothetical protein